MKKKIIVLVLVLIFTVSGIASAYSVQSHPYTEGTTNWVQGWSSAWDNGGYQICLEVELFDFELNRLGVANETNTSFVTAHTGTYYGYNVDLCVTLSDAWTL